MVSTLPSCNTFIAYLLDLQKLLTGLEWARAQMDDGWEEKNCGKQQAELEVEDRQQILVTFWCRRINSPRLFAVFGVY